ncbi:MAG: hypothetical protein R3F11_02780 [Verrucomicrobiales bacterium]
MLRSPHSSLPPPPRRCRFWPGGYSAARHPAMAIQRCAVYRRAIDARGRAGVSLSYTLDVEIAREAEWLAKRGAIPGVDPAPGGGYAPPSAPASADPGGRPVVIGSGPCGIFCAYVLAMAGLRPVVLERGKAATARGRPGFGRRRPGVRPGVERPVWRRRGGHVFRRQALHPSLRQGRPPALDPRNPRRPRRAGRHFGQGAPAHRDRPTDQSRAQPARRHRTSRRRIPVRCPRRGAAPRRRPRRRRRAGGRRIPRRRPRSPRRRHSARHVRVALAVRRSVRAKAPFSMGVRIEHPQG